MKDQMTKQAPIYAHTLPQCDESMWEPLYGEGGHAQCVAVLCAQFCAALTKQNDALFEQLGYQIGYYHDMGKASMAFQKYLKDSAAGKSPHSVDHKTAAAAFVGGSKALSCLLPYVFYGHHTGLPSGTSFYKDTLKTYSWDAGLVDYLPADLQSLPLDDSIVRAMIHGYDPKQGGLFALSFAIRMLHSCLIDADWLATEAFMDKAQSKARENKPYESLAVLSARLENHINQLSVGELSPINALRKEIHEACYTAGTKKQGVYKLNVPTGGGKTLSSLSFALRHALEHGLQRVIYVIPYTSIIEQTASEFREILGDNQVLEHHSNISEEHDTEANRFAAENWDAPLIVTTNVQFFESLFSHKNARCRKVHHMAQSVIIFDEAQMLPCAFLAPCLAAMKCLQRVYGASLVLCTATQPALENRDGFAIGWQPDEVQSLIGKSLEQRLAQQMKRVEIFSLGAKSQADLLGHLRRTEEDSALFIMNLTRQAQDFYKLLEKDFNDGRLFHLSARMCPAHRGAQIKKIKQRLAQGQPTILVATRVVEAGVDLSFPLVYRDRCGLDSLAQSAGRCNRHGELPMGETYYFEAEEKQYQLPQQFAESIIGANALQDMWSTPQKGDLLSADGVKEYFCRYYRRCQERIPNWDSKAILADKIGEFKQLDSIKDIDFVGIGQVFHLIHDGQQSLMMPYGEAAERLRSRLLQYDAMGLMPTREDYRDVAKLSVTVYTHQLERLIPHLETLHHKAGILMLCSTDCYDEHLGLRQEENDEAYVQ